MAKKKPKEIAADMAAELVADKSADQQGPGVQFSGDDNAQEMTLYTNQPIRTVEDALVKGAVDTAIWEVDRFVLKSWDVGAKGPDKKVRVTPLWGITVFLKRKAPKAIQDGIKLLLADFAKAAPKIPARTYKQPKDRHLLEISLYDVHLAKRCWAEATGTDYDVAIASRLYSEIADDLLAKSAGFAVDKIILPIGHDFFNVNNWQNTTEKGTIQSSTDDRMSMVFRIGWRMVRDLIVKCLEAAPVEVLYVPGNHDPETSFYLVELLNAVYESHKHVTVDASPVSRKYRRYGVNLIGYTHGNDLKIEQFPHLIYHEPEQLGLNGGVQFREWRTGHFHKKQERRFMVADSKASVLLRTIPSISGTDEWHFRNGFVDAIRAAEAGVWSYDSGPIAEFTSVVRN